MIEDNGFTGRQCSRCGVIFVSPRPTQAEMNELYDAGEAYLTPEFFLATADSLLARVEAWQAVRGVRRHVRSGGFLDIGPGSGMVLAAARDAGFDAYGVELNPVQADFIRRHRRVPCVTSMAEVSTLGRASFDVVYHRDVISHFYDPIAEFERINRLLTAGGYHIFQTGNFGDVDHRHFKNVRSFQYPDHLFFYSHRALLELLQRTGFEHVETVRYSTLPERSAHAWLMRIIGRERNQVEGSMTKSAPISHAEPPSEAGRAAREVLDFGYWSLRNTVGKLRISDSTPQTMTVISRKTG